MCDLGENHWVEVNSDFDVDVVFVVEDDFVFVDQVFVQMLKLPDSFPVAAYVDRVNP